MLFASRHFSPVRHCGASTKGAQDYQSLVDQIRIQHLRLTPHAAGWYDKAWDLVHRAASIRGDDQLKSQATGVLAGLNARQIKQVPDAAVALCFDRDGKRLLMGGTGKGLTLWHHSTDQTERQDQDLVGPFALRADGTPLQLGPTRVEKSKPFMFPLRLWNMSTQRIERTFVDPVKDGSEHLVNWAISPDAARVGAAVERTDGKRVLVVRDTETGYVMRTIVYPASDLAFAPDHSLLAAWDEAGRLDLWSLPSGEPAATLTAGTSIHAAAFGPIIGGAVGRQHQPGAGCLPRDRSAEPWSSGISIARACGQLAGARNTTSTP